MLDKAGIVDDSSQFTAMNVCADCFVALLKKKVPQLALANGLYRGEFPEYFRDLTWVEEKICAIYSTTAHVARLFQSSDPTQLWVFHGNVCVHEMNVVSTASVSPRTPADINGFLSIVFVGPGKFNPDQLGPMFRVRKNKIWAFLMWLKHHNHLYSDIRIKRENLELYPTDDIIPGLSERVIENHKLDVKRVFEEETAGFQEHPAELLVDGPHENDDGSVVTMLEKTGVSDPECDNISGQTFVAAAIKNLFSENSSLPDLVMH
ncbi:hypothetical protein DFH29DRAFT_812170 [Suillus ampliporus]|nr:hypothetical protein DFH29DRAFT_812170 [Suillus ampliporus]